MGNENLDDRRLIIESISAVHAVDSVEFEQMVSDQMAEIGAVKKAAELRASLDSLRQAGDRVKLVVARLGQDLVGFALLNVCFGLESGGEYLWLNELHVREGYRGNGIGAAILEHLKAFSAAGGYAKILGLCGEDLRRFYEREGFAVEETRLLEWS